MSNILFIFYEKNEYSAVSQQITVSNGKSQTMKYIQFYIKLGSIAPPARYARQPRSAIYYTYIV